MSFNTFGKLFRFTTWGESHGPAIGCVVDGCPPNVPIKESDIQKELNKRKPGQSKFTTQRKEDDKINILSGVFEGRTTGTPISLIIYNKDMRSRDYETIKNKFRPGHADYTYFKKYGIRDYRGGGRQSARETAARVAAGAIAKVVLKNKIGKNYQAVGAVTQLGILGCDLKKWKDKTISSNPFYCPDKTVIKLWEKYLLGIRKAGSSCGAIIEVRARGVPLGLGAPIYSKLDMDLAAAMMSINAVKGVNIGSGMNSAMLTGEENSDEILKTKGKTSFKSNNAGGILGGISTGQEINVSFGGTLFYRVHQQDSKFDHRMPSNEDATLEEIFKLKHRIDFTDDSYFKKLINQNDFIVNSLHGQGINKLGNNLTVEANSEDGLIEAISIKNYPSFSVSVQWHAEYHPEKKENSLNKKLFESFGKACLKYKS